jgi:hypothetical protein
MASSITTVFIGATRKRLRWVATDAGGSPIPSAGASARLIGVSADLPAVTFDIAGVLEDAAAGSFLWDGLGDDATGYPSEADLGAQDAADFSLQVKYTDAASRVDYGEPFVFTWAKPQSA